MGISAALGSSALLPAGLGFRNVLINGDFKVWQRGTSKAMATGSGTGYLADRWTAARGGYATGGTVSRQTASLDGFQYCSRVQRDSGNTGTSIIYYFQTLESVTSVPLANKPVTYSFYIRAGANFSGSVTAKLYSGTATDQGNYPDGGITGQATVITSTLSLTTSWQRVVLYGNVSSTATQLFVGFEWTPSGTAGAVDFFEVTGVQLEQNLQPTTFEQRPIGVELALCQRYYWRTNGGGLYSTVGLGVYQSGTASICLVKFPVTMRANPSSVEFSGMRTSDGYSGGTSVSSMSLDYSAPDQVSVYVVHGAFGSTGGRPSFLQKNNNAAHYVAFVAEL